MCIIIDNRNGKRIDPEVLDNCVALNPDGFGFFDLTTHKLITGLDMKRARKLLASEKPYIAHCRYATVGDVSFDNCHPFRVPGVGWLFQNGTVKGVRTSGEESDTKAIASLLQYVKKRDLKKFLGSLQSRFLLIKDNGDIIRSGEWHESGGALFSKADVLETLPSGGEHFVAVYGTLKQGLCNSRFLQDAEFICNAVTADRMRLCVDGLPYLIEGACDDGENVHVEIYSVDDDTLEDLDGLEGHPHYYRRQIQQFLPIDSSEVLVDAWCYLVPESYDSGVYHRAYEESEDFLKTW